MPDDVVELVGVEAVERVLDGDRWWESYTQNLPRVMEPVVEAIAGNAPQRSGKLAGAGFAFHIKPDEGGLDLDIAALVPYGHLPERGFRKVPRGSTEGTKRHRRKALLYRRLFGGSGYVPGQYFALRTVEELLTGALATLELLVMADLEAAA